jgi:hypothetical protein
MCKQYFSFNSMKQFIFVMVKPCVLFEVRIEFLNIIKRASASEV